MASISFKSKKDNSKNYGLNSGLSYTPQYDYSQVAANPVSFKSQATPATQSGATADASKGGVIPDNTGNSG